MSARHGEVTAVALGGRRVAIVAVCVVAAVVAIAIACVLAFGGADPSRGVSAQTAGSGTSTSIAPTNGETDVDGPDASGEGTADFSQLVGGGTEAFSDSSNDSQPQDANGEGNMAPSGDSSMPSHPDSDSMNFGKMY